MAEPSDRVQAGQQKQKTAPDKPGGTKGNRPNQRSSAPAMGRQVVLMPGMEIVDRKELTKLRTAFVDLYDCTKTIRIQEILGPYRILGNVSLSCEADGSLQPTFKIKVWKKSDEKPEPTSELLTLDEANARVYSLNRPTPTPQKESAPPKSRTNDERLFKRVNIDSAKTEGAVKTDTIRKDCRFLGALSNQDWQTFKKSGLYRQETFKRGTPWTKEEISNCAKTIESQGFVTPLTDLRLARIMEPNLKNPTYDLSLVFISDQAVKSFRENSAAGVDFVKKTFADKKNSQGTSG